MAPCPILERVGVLESPKSFGVLRPQPQQNTKFSQYFHWSQLGFFWPFFLFLLQFTMNRMWGSQHASGGQYPPPTAQAGGDAAGHYVVDYPACHPAYSSLAQRFGPTTTRRPALWIHESRIAPRHPFDQSTKFQVLDPASSASGYFHPQQTMNNGKLEGNKNDQYPEVRFYEHPMMNSNPASTLQTFRPEIERHVSSRVQAQWCASPPRETAFVGYKDTEHVGQKSPVDELDKRKFWKPPSRDSNLACTDMAVDAQLLLEAANQAAKEVRSITPVSSPTSAFGKPSIKVSPPLTFCEIIDSSELVSMDLYGTVGDALLVAVRMIVDGA